jgi:hypothetical protein
MFTGREYNIQHLQNIKKYLGNTRKLYWQNIDRIVRIYERIPPGLIAFNLDEFPGIKQEINRELQFLAKQIHASIVQGINNEWVLSNNKNDAMVKELLGSKPLPEMLQQKWMGRNLEALTAFKERTIKGINLSERVWDITKGFSIDIEKNMALGIYEGTPAAQLASDMKVYLNQPDKLFRRVRDAQGNLQLSKAAKAYEPGRGVYRSSYKNALRLTRTETNAAYLKADHERWQKEDFVTGIEVRRSGVPYDCDICEALKGEYPKDFEFTGHHPNCLCYAVPILASEDELTKSIEYALDGKEYEFNPMTKMPDNFLEYEKEFGYH